MIDSHVDNTTDDNNNDEHVNEGWLEVYEFCVFVRWPFARASFESDLQRISKEGRATTIAKDVKVKGNW